MPELRRWWPLLAVVVLLVAAGATTSMTQLPLSRVSVGAGPAERLEPPSLPPPGPPRASSGFQVPGWIFIVVIGLAVAAAVAAIALAIGVSLRSGSRFRRRMLRKRDQAQKPPSGVDAEVVAALDAGLLELDEVDADPRRAVIACWVRLERAAAAAGTPRRPGDTATDLVLRLLEGHQLSGAVLTGFADVYRLARYAARHEVDEHMREQAKAALWRLRGELTGVPA